MAARPVTSACMGNFPSLSPATGTTGSEGHMTSWANPGSASPPRAAFGFSLPGSSEGPVFSSSHPPSPRAPPMAMNHGTKAARCLGCAMVG